MKITLRLIFIVMLSAMMSACIGASQNNFLPASADLQTGARTRMSFPKAVASDLNGKAYRFPEAFRGRQTLILFGFEYAHQKDLDIWIAATGAPLKKQHPDFWVIEMPVIKQASFFYRLYVNNAKKYFIPDPAARLRSMSFYVPMQDFLTWFSFPNVKNTYQILFNQNGEERWRADGPFTAEKLKSLEASLVGKK